MEGHEPISPIAAAGGSEEEVVMGHHERHAPITPLDALADLTDAEKKERGKLWRWPRAEEKQKRFDESIGTGVISPIARTVKRYSNCNFKCQHCMVEENMPRTHDKLAGHKDPRPVMTDDDWRMFFQEADEYGLYRMVITGTEPTMWKDLFEFIAMIQEYGHLPILDSNGWLLYERPNFIKELADAGIYRMQISLDSFIEADHDSFRNMPGSYKRVRSIVPEIIKSGMKLLLSTCIVQGRVFTQEFEDLMTYCDEQGAMLYVTYDKPTGSSAANMEPWMIIKPDADKVREDEKVHNVTTHMTPSWKRTKDGVLGKYDGCIIHKGIFTVEPWGNICGCPYIHWDVGNYKNEFLAHILKRGLLLNVSQHRKDCLVGEDRQFMIRHNSVIADRRARGLNELPVPFGEGFTNEDLIDPEFAKVSGARNP